MKKQFCTLFFLCWGVLAAFGQNLQLLRDIAPGNVDGVFNNVPPVVFRGFVWFMASNNQSQGIDVLWRTDGTAGAMLS